MVVGFKGTSFGSWVIRKGTFGEYSHVEWLHDINAMTGFGAFHKNGGVNYTGPHLHNTGTPYVVWEIECLQRQYDKFAEFSLAQKGKSYDWKGILGFPTFKDRNSADKWFCSELLTAACQLAGIRLFNWTETQPGVTSPNRFVLSPLLNKIKEGKT